MSVVGRRLLKHGPACPTCGEWMRTDAVGWYCRPCFSPAASAGYQSPPDDDMPASPFIKRLLRTAYDSAHKDEP